jgi:hypothetical protein
MSISTSVVKCGRRTAARSGKVIPSPRTIDVLERRFGDEIRSTFGIEPTALTREEAQYLIVSVPLTNSEIEQLQQSKRALSDYARKVFGPKK